MSLNSNSSAEQMKSIYLTTKKLSRLIENEDWDLLNESTAERQKALESVFARPIDENQKIEVTNYIEKILTLDKEYKLLVEKKKRTSIEKSNVIKKQYNAARSYQAINLQLPKTDE
jgi:hypothetical protein